MAQLHPAPHDDPDGVSRETKEAEQASENDLWFLPGPMEEGQTFCFPVHGQSQVEPQSSSTGAVSMSVQN